MNSKIKRRIEFENRNLNNEEFICFERAETIGLSISSEGELEQVKPILQILLHEYQFKLNLIYTSPSVEAKIIAFKNEYSTRINICRLPILTFYKISKQREKLLQLLEVNKFIFVRYDFYFFLIKHLLDKNIPLILLQAKYSQSFFKLSLMKIFEKISFSLKADEVAYKGRGNLQDLNKINSIDFRIYQILHRLSQKNNHSVITQLQQFIQNNSFKTAIVFGSYYAEEEKLFKQMIEILPNSLFVLVPHHLSSESLIKIEESFTGKNYLLAGEEQLQAGNLQEWSIDPEAENYLILNVRGLLCEIYSLFDYAYVGGGFGYSIHSVLEPFLAGCHTMYGPNNHRSTEKDLCFQIDAKRSREIKSGKEMEDFVQSTLEDDEKKKEFLSQLNNDYGQEELKSKIKWILDDKE